MPVMDVSRVKALTFDTGGTILDWYTGIRGALEETGRRRGVTADWNGITREFRKRTLATIVNCIGPRFNFDDVHRDQLDRLLADRGVTAFTAEDRDRIWRTMYHLDAWPGFPEAARRLRKKYPVISFTLLTTPLVMSVSRRNGVDWDAIISCEMLGVYKVQPAAYQAAAKLLHLAPQDILMVACHNFDLDAARKEGFKTCFVRRPDEWGPDGPPDPEPNPACDIVVADFAELAERMAC